MQEKTSKKTASVKAPTKLISESASALELRPMQVPAKAKAAAPNAMETKVMKADVVNTQLKKVSDIELNAEIFGLEPRPDILSRVVQWQLAKRQAGTHSVKERGDVSGSTKKIVKQKGTGSARHGSRRGAQFRGGGIIFGPLTRSHAYDLPKKVRKLGLKMALSAKFMAQEIIIVDSLAGIDPKLKALQLMTNQIGDMSILLMDVAKSENILRASANLCDVDVLLIAGANVYDILRKQKLVLTVSAVKALEERLI
jgi:large subunit ribosomal protein L4